MIRTIVRRAAVLALFTAASGCTSHFATDRAAVAYNHNFANARNEVLLLNILRAWAHEPMQFSTISQVSGSVRTGAEISLPFTNLLEGGDQAEFGPSLKLTARNPAVTILPLETREFVQGITRPVNGAVIDNLIAQGWPNHTVLALAIAGVECPDRVRMNYTPFNERAEAFRAAFHDSQAFDADVEPVARFAMDAGDALEAIREGAGAGRQVRLANPPGDNAPGQASPGLVARQGPAPEPETAPDKAQLLVEVLDDEAVGIRGLNFARVCGQQLVPARQNWPLITRSIQSMLRYLAEVHRSNYEWSACGGAVPPALSSATPEGTPVPPFRFRILSTCPGMPAPVDAAISTTFHGQTFYVPRASLDDPQDQTLIIFSILTELLAQQVSEQTLAASRPIIAVGQ